MEANSAGKNKDLKNLVLSTLKMSIATFCSRVLGLVRELLMASYFGASGLSDAFFVAFRIPNLLRDLFAEGAFSSAFVPTFTEAKNRSVAEARKLFWSVFFLLLIVTGVISFLMIIGSKEIVFLMTSTKFHADQEKFLLTVSLVKIMAPFLTLISLAALCMGTLNTFKIFFLPSMSPAAFNVVTIISIVASPFLFMYFSIPPIYAMALGVIVGGLLQFCIQLPAIFKIGIVPILNISKLTLISTETKKIAKRMAIAAIGLSANQINLIINTSLASGIVGAVSWLSYAFRLFQFPVGIVSVSVASSNLVHFSEHWKNGDLVQAKKFFKKSFLLNLFIMVPIAMLLIPLAKWSVHLVYERGIFDRMATIETARALQFYVLGIPFYGLYKILVPVFYTIDRPKIPVFISMSSIAINIVFCLSLIGLFGHVILAFGLTISMMLNVTILSFFLYRYLNLEWTFFINLRVLRILFSGVLLIPVIYFFQDRFMNDLTYFSLDILGKIFFLGLFFSLGFLFYLFLIFASGDRQTVIENLLVLKEKFFRKRFCRKS